MQTIISVTHVNFSVNAKFEDITENLESLLHLLDPKILNDVIENPGLVSEKLTALEGEQGFMLFDIRDHGDVLAIVSGRRKARQYSIGNPLIAISMTKHDIRAALYAPLVVLVYEDNAGKTNIEYDLPSSLFGQFDVYEVDTIAKSLDEKLTALLKKAGADI
jgi:uncharacterized protein (DUF302 family)